MTDLMQFIDINPIVKKAEEENCPFIAIIGGKGTGKTYGCVDNENVLRESDESETEVNNND